MPVCKLLAQLFYVRISQLGTFSPSTPITETNTFCWALLVFFKRGLKKVNELGLFLLHYIPTCEYGRLWHSDFNATYTNFYTLINILRYASNNYIYGPLSTPCNVRQTTWWYTHQCFITDPQILECWVPLLQLILIWVTIPDHNFISFYKYCYQSFV